MILPNPRNNCMHLIYAARHVCIARTLPGNMSVRLSVCPSVTRQHSVDIAELILIFYSQLVSPFCFFPYQTGWQYSDRTHEGVPEWNARGIKKSQFSTNISLYLGNDEGQSHSYYGRRIRTAPKLLNGTSLNDLK